MKHRQLRRTAVPALLVAALVPCTVLAPAQARGETPVPRAAVCHRTLPAYSDVGPGEHDRTVRTLQCFLNDAGATVEVDGKFGLRTKHAVISVLRRAHPKFSSGEVHTDQWVAIISATLPDRTLANGDDGHAVRTLQRALWSGYLGPEIPFAIDGDFGPQTERYLKRFQSLNGIVSSGKVNRATRALLRYGAYWGYEG